MTKNFKEWVHDYVVHPFDFLKMVQLSRYGCNNTSEIREELKDIHPSVFIGNRISTNIYKISYSYEVVRNGKRKNREKYKLIFSQDNYDEEYEKEIMLENEFDTFVDDYNREHKYGTMLNVKILSIEFYCTASFYVG